MPRGHKSKHRARERRHQAQEESKNPVSTETTRPEKEKSPSSPTSDSTNVPQSPSATETPSNPPMPGGVQPNTTAAAAVSNVSSDESAKQQGAESSNASKVPLSTVQFHKGPLHEKAVRVVHYLLYKYQLKEPITKTDILRNVTQVQKSKFHDVLKRASDYLELVFGLDVKELDPNRNTYLLINKLQTSCDEGDNGGVPVTGVLMIVLGVIFTNGNCATEEAIWAVLNVMGLYAGKKNSIYGDPRKLIAEHFVHQKYLEARQVPNSDPPRYEFLWGSRAHAETTKMKVLEFWAKIHNAAASDFAALYEEAVRDEEERFQARAAARARIAAAASARSQIMVSVHSKAKDSSPSNTK